MVNRMSNFKFRVRYTGLTSDFYFLWVKVQFIDLLINLIDFGKKSLGLLFKNLF